MLFEIAIYQLIAMEPAHSPGQKVVFSARRKTRALQPNKEKIE
jgi:hypothetical protein